MTETQGFYHWHREMGIALKNRDDCRAAVSRLKDTIAALNTAEAELAAANARVHKLVGDYSVLKHTNE